MNPLPHTHRYQRPARVRPAEYTPAVLRLDDGSCTQGGLLIFSVTGGLLSLQKPLNRGSHAKLMFLTPSGPVLGEAEMLRAVSWNEQPFRFVSLYENDQRRLLAETQPEGQQPMAVPEHVPLKLELTPPPPLEATTALDREQLWIEKYRAAIDQTEQPRKRFPRMFFAAVTATTLGWGVLYAVHTHLLR
jgi:hypothetical protein